MIKTRFAPSPTGKMHVGNLRTAIYAYLFAKSQNGKFFLRIEDTDLERSKKEYEDFIIETLTWMNIEYENFVIKQSEKIKTYQEIALNMKNNGFAYYCLCEKVEDINNLTKRERCFCRDKNLENGVLRFKVIDNNENLTFNDIILGEIKVNINQVEDFALLRSDGSPTYMLCVVVDDAFTEITHVLRGNEHLFNTFKQIMIYKANNWNIPLFGHLPMIKGKDGSKLSKRNGDADVESYKLKGIPPEAVFNFLLRLGWGYKNTEIISFEECVKIFYIKNISKSPALFDEEKLKFFSKHYLKQEKNIPLFFEFFKNKISRELTRVEKDRIEILWKELTIRCWNMEELCDFSNFLLEDFKCNKIGNIENIKKTITTLESIENWNVENIEQQLRTLGLKEISKDLRMLLVGKDIAPSLFQLIFALGKKETINRLTNVYVNI